MNKKDSNEAESNTVIVLCTIIILVLCGFISYLMLGGRQRHKDIRQIEKAINSGLALSQADERFLTDLTHRKDHVLPTANQSNESNTKAYLLHTTIGSIPTTATSLRIMFDCPVKKKTELGWQRFYVGSLDDVQVEHSSNGTKTIDLGACWLSDGMVVTPPVLVYRGVIGIGEPRAGAGLWWMPYMWVVLGGLGWLAGLWLIRWIIYHESAESEIGKELLWLAMINLAMMLITAGVMEIMGDEWWYIRRTIAILVISVGTTALCFIGDGQLYKPAKK